jgi:hypothetical protein
MRANQKRVTAITLQSPLCLHFQFGEERLADSVVETSESVASRLRKCPFLYIEPTSRCSWVPDKLAPLKLRAQNFIRYLQ